VSPGIRAKAIAGTEMTPAVGIRVLLMIRLVHARSISVSQ
jgi:hypothetical protein